MARALSFNIRFRNVRQGLSVYLDYGSRKNRRREWLGLILDGNPEADAEKMRMVHIIKARREIEYFSTTHGIVTPYRARVSLPDYIFSLKTGVPPTALKSIHHIQEFFGSTYIGDVDLAMCEEYQQFLLDEKELKDGSVESYMGHLSTFFNRAVKEKVIQANPTHGMKRIHGGEGIPKCLNEEEVERLHRTPLPSRSKYAEQIRKAFLFCCDCNLRLGDILSLTWKEIRNRQIERIQNKTGGITYVPINDVAWSLINPGNDSPAPDELVFGMTVEDFNPGYILKPWGRAAGIPFDITFHSSRHTFARRLLEKGVDLATVQKLMGHKRIETTARYVKATLQAMKEAVTRLVKKQGDPQDTKKPTRHSAAAKRKQKRKTLGPKLRNRVS